MIGRLTVFILFCTLYLIHTADVPHQVFLTVVKVGGNVTLHCPFSVSERLFQWFKQPLGYLVQTVATGSFGKPKLSEQFSNSRFIVTAKDPYSLTITNISKEDEATYFCLSGTVYLNSVINGTFLAVNDSNQQKSFYVKQSPKSVQVGDRVNLQCSLHSKNKENRVQCPGEHRVYWFRYAAGESHPGIIYTHSDEQVERSCVYRTVQNSSDIGTYYCAVVTCGEILFGEGTKVETRSNLDPVVLVLGVLLACCLIVNVVLIFYVNRRKVCEHCKGEANDAHNPEFDSTVDQSTDLDGDREAVNYAALNFSARKVNRVKKRETPTECVYSTVKSDNYTRHHL